MRQFALVAVCVGLLLALLAAGSHSQNIDGGSTVFRPDKPIGEYSRSIIYPNFAKYGDLEALTRDSGTVVVGVVQSSYSKFLPARKDFIFTKYQVYVKDTLKGSLKHGESIDVIVAGGKVQVDDHLRELAVPSYWKNPEIGRTYVLFLRDKTGANQEFLLIGGPQGLFEISSDKRVEPQVLRGDPLMRKNRNKEAKVFLQEIRGAVQNQAKKSWP